MANQPTVKGIVEEALAGNLFRVKLEDGKEVMAHLSGKMRFHHIRIVCFDRVEVALDPFGGKTTNRIEKRL